MASSKLENLEELRILSTVIDAGSLAGAAEQLGLVPRTVGRRLAALEQRLGQTLIHRTTRSQQPTVLALRLVEDCREALRLLDIAEDRMAGELGEIGGLVRISLPSLFSADVVTAAKAFSLKYPALRLEFETHDGPMRDLGAKGLDLAVVAERPQRGSDLVQRVGLLHSVLAATPEYLATHGEPSEPGELPRHECLCFGRQEVWTLVRGRKKIEVSVSGRITSTDSRLLRNALVSGLGIGPVSPSWLESSPLEVKPVLPGWRWPTITMWLMTSSSSHDLNRVKVVQQLIRTAFAEALFSSQ